jgi:hypothetical protein
MGNPRGAKKVPGAAGHEYVRAAPARSTTTRRRTPRPREIVNARRETSWRHARMLESYAGGSAMTLKFLRYAALLVALASPLAGCMPGAPSNPQQAQYLSDLRPCAPGTHSESFPITQGYRCVLDP